MDNINVNIKYKTMKLLGILNAAYIIIQNIMDFPIIFKGCLSKIQIKTEQEYKTKMANKHGLSPQNLNIKTPQKLERG